MRLPNQRGLKSVLYNGAEISRTPAADWIAAVREELEDITRDLLADVWDQGYLESAQLHMHITGNSYLETNANPYRRDADGN